MRHLTAGSGYNQRASSGKAGDAVDVVGTICCQRTKQYWLPGAGM